MNSVLCRSKRRGAFTILEMLIAMAVTLLLMGALAQAFKLIGERMQSSRAQVGLSNQLRGITFQLREELGSHTVDTVNIPAKASEGSGYFTYYDGPVSDLTTTLHGTQPDSINESSYQDSKFGDFDDYLAFTAEAPGDSWFTGKVPAYIVDPSLANTPAGLTPTVIRSKYAEIIYWCSPEVSRNADGTPVLVTATGMPLYPDLDGNRVPDRFNLHRRILLIRPDLNNPATGVLNTTEFTDGNGDTVRIGDLPTINNVLTMPYINTSPSQASAPAMQNSHWLTGLTLTHQMFDLSIRRVPAPGTGSLIVSSSRPQSAPSVLAANSLADLTAPENRFAHVRIPGEYFRNTSDAYTSMPLLALGFDNALFSGSPQPSTLGVPLLNVRGGSVQLMNGFLLPQFELSNLAQGVTGLLVWDRSGEDVLATNVLAFDVQAFDSQALNLLTVGPDNAPGIAGVNDLDPSAGNPDASLFEYGAAGSDDTVVTVNDLDIYQMMQIPDALPQSPGVYPSIAWPAANPPLPNPIRASLGGYVDLGYVFQAGSPLQCPPLAMTLHNVNNPGNQLVLPFSLADPLPLVRRQIVGRPITNPSQTAYLQSDFSGYVRHDSLQNSIPAITDHATDNVFVQCPDSLTKSGKAAFSSNYDSQNNRTPTMLFYQPTYDTWSDHYESDGFDQGQIRTPGNEPIRGTFWILNSLNTNYTPPQYVPNSSVSTYYFGPSGPRVRIDEGLNGVDNGPVAGIDDGLEKETSPPFAASLRNVKIRIRLEDNSSREIIESSVISAL